VGFIAYLLCPLSRLQVRSPACSAPREREPVIKGENLVCEATLGNYSETNQQRIRVVHPGSLF